MKNEQKIIQNFIGEINGVEITHEPTYWETGNVLDRFAEKFNDAEVTKEFTEDLAYGIMEQWNNSGEIEMAEIGKEIENCIKKAEKFENVKIEVYGSEYHFEDFNRKIKNGDYLTKGGKKSPSSISGR